MNLEFLTLPRDERNEIITECSARLGVPAVITEKDFWVCWMLGVLFQSSFADSLVFKGVLHCPRLLGPSTDSPKISTCRFRPSFWSCPNRATVAIKPTSG